MAALVATGTIARARASTEGVSTSDTFGHIYKTPVEAERAARRALQGSGDDAMGLSFYAFALGDDKASSTWFNLAVENNNLGAIEKRAYDLVLSSDECSVTHGIYLYEKYFRLERRRRTAGAEARQFLKDDRDELAAARVKLKTMPRQSCVTSPGDVFP
jgi:hypothetical protein